MNRTVYIISGPTASGKSLIAYYLAKRIRGEIEGEGKLIGLINNDLRRTTPFTSTEDITHFGRAYAVVQSTRKSGRIMLKLHVEGIDKDYSVEMRSN